MKAKRKTKQAGKRNAERAETTRGAQAAQGAANGCAKRARPVWVDESDAEEITDFDKPSPHLFTSACSFIWDAAETAYRNGDNALLSREGVADALEFIAHGVIIGSGLCDAAGSYDYMLEDWRIIQENKKRAAAHYEGLNATAKSANGRGYNPETAREFYTYGDALKWMVENCEIPALDFVAMPRGFERPRFPRVCYVRKYTEVETL